MPLSPGKRLGSYEILATIGVGGMGEVYKALDTRLDRVVAIKILPEHIASDPGLRHRFEREAKAISSLSHAHICTLYDVGSEAGVDFLVMEYLEGETAAQRLAKGPIPLSQVLRYGAEIAEALDRAHRQGVTHRDLKPGNVMLTKAGAKLLDFGLAKRISLERDAGSEATASPDLTASGTILGTLQYMAPEQVEAKTVDHRADIFAFGAILYEMATRKKAFDGGSQASLIGAILRDQPEPISALQPLSPPALDALVATCLAKDPDDRWQSAADVGRQLRLMQGSSPTLAAMAERGSRVTPTTRSGRAAWWTAAAAAAVAAAFAALYFLRSTSELPETRVEIVTPATRDPHSFAISPDGRMLVFAGDDEEGQRLWLRSLDSATAQPLSGTEGATYPFWSPNSRSVAFFAAGKLKRIDIDGGPPRILGDATEGRGGAWSVEDVIVFSPAPGAPLQRVSGIGGDAATVLGDNVLARFPAFLPDGRRFVFLDLTTRSAAGRPRGIYLGSLDSAETMFLTAAETAAKYLAPGWLLSIRGTTLVAQRFNAERGEITGDAIVVADPVGFDANVFASAFSVSTTGSIAYRSETRSLRQLTWFERSGRPAGTVGPPEESDLLQVELSPDERQVAVMRLNRGTRNVWLLDVSRGVSSRFTDDPVNARNPVWSADGQRIAYASDRSEDPGIYGRNATNSSEQLLVGRSGGDTRDEVLNDWSADERFLLFTKFSSETGADLWVAPVDGNGTPTRFAGTRYREESGQFSPDGRWIAYRSDESGRSEIYIQKFPNSARKLQVSTQGGSEPRWSTDGAELFYFSLDVEVMAARLRWSEGEPEVVATSTLFSTRKVRGGASSVTQQYDVSRDGRFLINTSVDGGSTSPISLLLNWKEPDE